MADLAGEGRAPALFIQFARLPVAGQVKTRLIPALGAEQACQLHRDLLAHVWQQLTADAIAPTELWLAAAPGRQEALLDLDLPGCAAPRWQSEGDLGRRMFNALTDGLSRACKVVLVGSDCPALDSAYLSGALDALDHSDIVIGPATDGGYVLIGASRILPELFEEVPWGTDSVYRKTCELAAAAGLSWQSLPALADIDRPEDLPEWQRRRAALE